MVCSIVKWCTNRIQSLKANYGEKEKVSASYKTYIFF